MSQKHGNWVRGMMSGMSPEIAGIAEATARILDSLGEECDRRCENYILELIGITTDRHCNEEAARIIIGRMDGKLLRSADGTLWRGSVSEYLQALGIDAETAGEALRSAHASLAEETDGEVDTMDRGLTDYDALVLIARAFAVHWHTSHGDIKTASELAVEDVLESGWKDIWEELTD